jgi:hypothetical protein
MCCINKKITCQIHVQFSAQCSHKLYFLYNSSLLFLFCATYTWAQNICPGLPVCSIKCLFLEGKNNRGSLKMSLCFKFGRISLLASKWQVHKRHKVEMTFFQPFYEIKLMTSLSLLFETSEDIITKLNLQALHIMRIKYWNGGGSGNHPFLILVLLNKYILLHKKATLGKHFEHDVHT